MTAPPTTATRPPLTPCPARRRHRPTPTPWPARHRHTRLLQKCSVSATGATSFSPHLPAVPYPTPILPRLHPHPNPHPTPHQALRHRRPGTREAQRGAGGGGGRGGADETDRHAQGEESGGLRHAVRSPLPPLPASRRGDSELAPNPHPHPHLHSHSHSHSHTPTRNHHHLHPSPGALATATLHTPGAGRTSRKAAVARPSTPQRRPRRSLPRRPPASTSDAARARGGLFAVCD